LRFRQLLASGLAALLALPLSAQQSSGPRQTLVNPPKGTLTINVLEGEGARNSIQSRTAVAPVVEVKDASGAPVAGAEVVFQLPAVGPGGSFNGWLKTQTVRTDEQGKATVSGYAPNPEPGRFNIKVTATSGSQTGSVVISQINVENGASAAASARKSNWWKWALGAGAAAAVGGGIAASRNGKTGTTATAASTPVSISVGAVTVGGPR
jgi:hypothetical protein